MNGWGVLGARRAGGRLTGMRRVWVGAAVGGGVFPVGLLFGGVIVRAVIGRRVRDDW